MEITDYTKITDKHGFNYTVIIKHHPVIGVSIAYYDDCRIASREYGRMQPPMGDDDREWEEWEERFREWADGAITDLQHECKLHFDKKN